MMFPDPSNDQQRAALRLAAARAAAARTSQTEFEPRIQIPSEQVARRYNFGGQVMHDSRLIQQR